MRRVGLVCYRFARRGGALVQCRFVTETAGQRQLEPDRVAGAHSHSGSGAYPSQTAGGFLRPR